MELSNDGVEFSADGLEVRYIETAQLESAAPRTGPEEGLTIVTITLEDVPVVNGVIPEPYCEFEGGVVVKAKYLNATAI